MTESEKELVAGFIALGRARLAADAVARTVKLERKINEVPFHVELMCGDLQDEGLRDSIVALTKLDNLLNEVPPSFRAFCLASRDNGLQNIFEHLANSECIGLAPVG